MTEPLSKVCTKCGENKPLDDFSPANSLRHPHLRRGVCKKCRAGVAKEDRKDFPDKHRELEKRRSGKQKRREYTRKRQRRLYAQNRESICAERRPKYRAAYAANPEKFRQKNRRYQKANVNIWIRTNAKRRARKKGLPDTFSKEEQTFMYQYFGFACAVCGHERGLLWTLAEDHWIPLSSPNCPGTISTNIVLLCDGLSGCNNSKKNADPHVWLLRRFGPKKAAKIEKAIATYFAIVAERFGEAVA